MEKSYIIGFTLTAVTFSSLVNGIIFPVLDKLESEATNIDISEVESSYVRHRRSSSSLPERTDLTLTINGEPVRLRLKRNDNININIPIYMKRNGKIQHIEVDEIKNSALYQDLATGGSLILQQGEGDLENHTQVFGSFYTNGSHYAVQPKPSCDTASCLHRPSHVVSKILPKTLIFDEPKLPDVKHVLKVDKRKSKRNIKRYRRQTMNYKIEVLFVIDYKLYQYWYNIAQSTNQQSQTLALIRQYYAYTLNGMDVRYKSISGMNFILDVLSAGMFIADTASDSPYTENYQVSGNIDGLEILDTFMTWVNNQNGLPNFDHAMAFTGYNVATLTNGVVTRESSGIAYTGTICTSAAVSLVEDDFNFIGITTAAHELGHSLDAAHDGSGNSCSSDDNFIMAIVNRVSPTPDIGANLWRFSSCSLEAFMNKVDELRRSNNNCLATESSGSTGPSMPVSMAEVYSPDETCRRVQGEGSYVCRGIQNYTAICFAMYCKDPDSSLCYTVVAPEGTPCGNNKWCDMGVCTSSSEAPKGPDDCPLGDRPGIIENGLTCTEIVQQSQDACYRLDKSCCESCKAVETGRTECQYGDQGAIFCSSISRYDCYSADIEAYCCGTCASLKNVAHVGCVFGDRFTGCNKNDCPFYSETDRAVGCCETCYDGPPLTTPPAATTTPTTTTTTPRPTTTTPRPTTTTPRPTTTTTTPRSTTSTTPRPTTVNTGTTQSPPTDRTTRRTDTSTDGTTTISLGTSTSLDSDSESSNLPIFIGIGVGAGVVVIIVIVIIICCSKRRSKPSGDAYNKPPPLASSYENTGFVYTENAPTAPHRPPPRRTTNGGFAPSNMANAAIVMPTSRLPSAPPKPQSNNTAVEKPVPMPMVPPSRAPPRRTDQSVSSNHQPVGVPMRPPGNMHRNQNGVAIISNNSSEYADGYMMPSTPSSLSSQQNIPSLYTAPNKSSSRDSISSTTHAQKRNTRPIHYRRPHDMIRNSASQRSSGEIEIERKHSDTYDCIGDVMAKLEILRGINNNDQRSLERRPTLPANRPTKRISEISNSSERDSWSEVAALPSITPVVPRKCYRDSLASNADTIDRSKSQKPESMVRPKPRPRERKLSNIDRQSVIHNTNNNDNTRQSKVKSCGDISSFRQINPRNMHEKQSKLPDENIALDDMVKDENDNDHNDIENTYDMVFINNSEYETMGMNKKRTQNGKLTNPGRTQYSSINEIEICI